MHSLSVPCPELPNPDDEGDSSSDGIFDISDSSEEERDELSVADMFIFLAKMVSSRRTSLLDLFRDVDEDSSGELDHDEVRVFRGLAGLEGLVDETLFHAFFDELDENGDGSITYTEFSSAIKKRNRVQYDL
jgi:Ca2+-binding EF-hand superfamily protein